MEASFRRWAPLEEPMSMGLACWTVRMTMRLRKVGPLIPAILLSAAAGNPNPIPADWAGDIGRACRSGTTQDSVVLTLCSCLEREFPRRFDYDQYQFLKSRREDNSPLSDAQQGVVKSYVRLLAECGIEASKP